MDKGERENILVTGGAGFIGSHLCDELVKSANVICVDNFTTSSVRNIAHLLEYPNFRFIKHDMNFPLDLESQSELEDFNIKYKGLQQVYHLACPTSAMNFDELMVETAVTNVYATKNALDLALKYKSKFLFSSSGVVYGPRTSDVQYINEDDVGRVNFLNKRACYDEGKRFAETLVSTYNLRYGLDTKILRIFRTYGPRMPIFDGQIVADYVMQALEGRDVEIYGEEDFSTTLCYIADVIDGMLKMMSTPGLNGPLNLGSDVVHKVVEIAQKIVKMTGSRSRVVFKEPLLFISPLAIPDLSRVKNQLGWLPVVPLDSGLKKTIEYINVERGVMNMR